MESDGVRSIRARWRVVTLGRCVRRDRGGGAMCRVSAGNASCPPRVPRLAPRPSALPERHRVHALHPPARRGARSKAWGLLDQVRATGCPPIEEVGWDIEGITFSRSSACAGWRRGSLRSAPVGPGRDPGAGSGGGRRRVPRDLHRQGARPRRRARRRHNGPSAPRRDGHRASRRGDRVPTDSGRPSPGRWRQPRARGALAEHPSRTTTYSSGVQIDRLEYHKVPGLGREPSSPRTHGLDECVSLAWSAYDYPEGVRSRRSRGQLPGRVAHSSRPWPSES